MSYSVLIDAPKNSLKGFYRRPECYSHNDCNGSSLQFCKDGYCVECIGNGNCSSNAMPLWEIILNHSFIDHLFYHKIGDVFSVEMISGL